MDQSKQYRSESEIQQRNHTGINANEVMRWIITISFLLLIASIIFGACNAHADDGRSRKASYAEIVFIHAVEMNCREPLNCALYVADTGRWHRQFLRLVLENGDDNPMYLRRGIIFRTTVRLDCTEALKCGVSASRVYNNNNNNDGIVTITLSSAMLQEKIVLRVPNLGDEY